MAKNQVTLTFAGDTKSLDKAVARVGVATRSMGKSFDKLGDKAGAAVKALGSVGAGLAGVASLAGPAVTGLLGAAKGIVAVAKAGAGLVPLVATLPALAGGLALVVGTAKLAGPAMGKAVEPIAKAFTRLGDEVGALASKDLPKLSREFVKVNFPSIRTAMRDIAESMNFVVRETGAWVNSASGQQAIRQITEATAKAMRGLAEPLSNVVFSFGELVRRVGGTEIASAGKQMERLAGATAKWMDSIDRADVNKALQDLGALGGKFRDVFMTLRDVGRWMSENEAKVKAFSDVVAGAAITLGIATGNIPAIVAGSFALVVNHWEDLKTKFGEAKPFFSNMWAGIRNDPNVRDIWKSMGVAFTDFVNSFRKEIADIGPKVRQMFIEWKRAWDEWAPVINQWWQNTGRPVLSALGHVLGFLLDHFVVSTAAAGKMFAVLGSGYKALHGVAAGAANAIASAFRGAFNSIVSAWNNTVGRISFTVPGWVPGLGGRGFSIPRFHTGGIVSGAHGREVLAVLQAGERVTPAGGGGGTAQTVTLRVIGNDRALVELIKRLVVVEGGGDVQAAFGR
jgi:hypothetical protein